MSRSEALEKVLTKLENVKKTPNGWEACCPAHDDRHASLSIGMGEDGRILLNCHAGCDPEAIVSAIGLKLADLFPPSPRLRRTSPTEPPPVRGRIAAQYPYCDASGALLFEVVRFDPKDFRQRRPDGKGGWIWSLGDTARVLYRLPGILAADKNGWVFVCEGEKDVDNVRALGLPATCNPGGAGKWGKLSDDSILHGKRVVIIPDRDEPGRKHAEDVAARLYGKVADLRVLDLGKVRGFMGKDITDWLDGLDCREPADLARALVDMAESAPVWTPPAPTATPVAKPVEPYRPFPVDSLPEPMRSFVAQAAEALGCDAAFVALPLLAASASAIGNTRRIDLKRGWTEPAIVWTCIVGDSGTLKSPALYLALRPLRRRQHETMKRHTQEMKAYDSEVLRYEIALAAWKKSKGKGDPPEKPKEPVPWRCVCDDTTIEALAVLLLQNWRGLLMARDELAGWFGGFDRYAQGKGGDVAKWLEMFGGRPVMVDRKTGDRKTIYIPRAAVSVTGGIQPVTLQRALGRAYFENGLASRLLLACPPRRVKRWSEKEIAPAVEDAVATIFDCLYSLEPIMGDDGEPEPGIVRLSREAKRVWATFYNEHAREHVALTGDLSAAWSKLEGYAARLALVVHQVRCSVGDPTLDGVDVVDEMSVAAGVALSRWFGQETRRAYAILAETDTDRQRRGLVELVQRRGGSATVRELMRSSNAYRTSEASEQALASLVQSGLGRWEDVGATSKGGRPTRCFTLADRIDTDTTPVLPKESGVSSTSARQCACR